MPWTGCKNYDVKRETVHRYLQHLKGSNYESDKLANFTQYKWDSGLLNKIEDSNISLWRQG